MLNRRGVYNQISMLCHDQHLNGILIDAMIETDYYRYFSAKTVVLLINMSKGKDSERFESFSGTIVSISNNVITMKMPYTIGLNNPGGGEGHYTYKLLSEVMGVGVQVLADLTKIENNIVHLRLRGNIEIFQRRQSARVDTTVGLYQFLREASMETYSKMCRSLTSHIESNGVPTEIQLSEVAINLSASGLRCSAARAISRTPAPLTMFLLDLGEQRPLICTVAELVWTRDTAVENSCGYRFINIRKKDRDLIARYVRSIAPKQELQDEFKKNWELLDRMYSEEAGNPEAA